MKKLLTILTPLTLMGLAGVAPAQAAIVAGWKSFNADTASYPKAADNVGANITSTGLDTAGLSRFDFPDFALRDWNTGSTVDTSEYVEFAVQPGAGFQVDFTNLQLNAKHDDAQLDLVLRSSVDGFTNNLGTQVSLTTRPNKYLGKINYTYLTPLLPLASCLLPIFTRKLILHDYLPTALT